MTNFLSLVAEKFKFNENNLFSDYTKILEDSNYFNTIINERNELYITSIITLVRVPFAEYGIFFDGMKDKYYDMILELYDMKPLLTTRILENSIYLKDLLNLWVRINNIDKSKEEIFEKYNNLIKNIRTIINNRRAENLNKIKANDLDNLNLIGKYCVNENSKFDKEAYWYNMTTKGLKKERHVSFMIRQNLCIYKGHKKIEYPVNKTIPFYAKKFWRQENVLLREKVGVVEQLLCSKAIDNTNDLYIPRKCLKLNSKLNTKKIYKTENMDIIEIISRMTSYDN